MTAKTVQGDTKQAIEFLRRWPTAYPHLVAFKIDPKTHEMIGNEGRAFTQADLADGGAVEKWINERQGNSNIYFTVNSLMTALNKKAKKTDVAELIAMQTDIDVPAGEDQTAVAEKIVEQLRAFVPEPSVIIMSGGGAQAFWILPPEDRIKIDGDPAKAEAAECYTRGLEDALSKLGLGKVDACHNVDRIMRLPGTINVPDARKIAKGRKPALAELVHFTDVTHPLSAFTPAEPKSKSSAKKQNAKKPVKPPPHYEVIDVDDPRLSKLSAKWKEIGFHGKVDAKYGDDSSRALMGFATACVGVGIAEDVIASCLMNWKINAHILKQPDVTRALNRTLERAKAYVADPELEELNEKHCVVSDIGGKCVVLNETIDPFSGERGVTFSGFTALADRYSNRWKTLKYRADVEKKVRLATWWRSHPWRRQVEQVVFMPGDDIPDAYNLWHGFSVLADRADSQDKCSFYLEHICNNICQGDHVLFRYVLRWMASGVQSPGRPGGAALVLRGKMGIGKGQFVQHYGSLFGRHFVPVTKAEHIAGRFNGHMGECIVLFADECFFPGNPQHEQILKVLVSEREWLIERKGIDAVKAKSCLHVILACNNKWSVPVDADDRRYCCIEVGDARMRDRAYFAAINAQMQKGGREALLGMLLALDLRTFNPEEFPRSTEHALQRARSRHGIDGFIEEVCHEGRLSWAVAAYPDVAITSGEQHGSGFDHFIRNKADAELRRMGPGKVKNALKRDWGCGHWKESRGERRAGVHFPPLADLRRAFIEKHGNVEWRAADVEEWETVVSRYDEVNGAVGRETRAHPADEFEVITDAEIVVAR